MQIYSITSGKGGVGKTSLVCNMALRFGAEGKRVLLIDADLGLANVDIMMGLKPTSNLSDMFAGDANLASLLIDGPPNVTVLPASSGVREMTVLSDEQIMHFMSEVNQLEQTFDVVLIDTGAGIGKNVLYFNAAAQNVIVVTTPEPTSITDAYAAMKVLYKTHMLKRFRLVVNRAKSRKQALKVYTYFTNVADEHLKEVSIDYLGHVLQDDTVSEAVMERTLLMEGHPTSDAAACISKLVETLNHDEPISAPTGNIQFFWERLLHSERGDPDEDAPEAGH
jgi:flagellar biosynthesis protein FlhG